MKALGGVPGATHGTRARALVQKPQRAPPAPRGPHGWLAGCSKATIQLVVSYFSFRQSQSRASSHGLFIWSKFLMLLFVNARCREKRWGSILFSHFEYIPNFRAQPQVHRLKETGCAAGCVSRSSQISTLRIRARSGLPLAFLRVLPSPVGGWWWWGGRRGRGAKRDIYGG